MPRRWAFVHFLMFGEEGGARRKLERLSSVDGSAGKDPAVSFTETLGTDRARWSGRFRLYYQRPIFSYRRMKIDVSVERERFPVRKLHAGGDGCQLRAMFHAATSRPVEARAADRRGEEGQPERPPALLCRRGHPRRPRQQGSRKQRPRTPRRQSSSRRTPMPTIRYASLTVAAEHAPGCTLVEVEKQLAKAIALNTRFADAYAWLGQVRAYARHGRWD